MADITVKFADGKEHVYTNVPDTITPDQIEQRAMQDFQGAKVAHLDRVSSTTAESTKRESVQTARPKITAGTEMEQANELTKNLVGFAAPMVKTYYGAKQLIAGLSPEERANLQSWQQMEEKAPILSTIAGNVAPMVIGGAGLARAGLKGATMLAAPKTAAQAAGVAGSYAALQPVSEDQLAGLGERAKAGTIGAALGFAGQKVAEKAGTYLANKFGQRGTLTSANIDESINETLKDSGQTLQDLPSDYANQLRQQVASSLQVGRKLDVPAALRAQEFKATGIEPTLGQVTRNPMQYATERNLRGVAGVGEPLLERFSGQETNLRNQIGNFAKGAADRYQAGTQIGGALESADKSMSQKVSELYRQAKQSAGKDMELPLQGLAQDYATVLRDFGDKIPSGVRNNFEDLGLLTGKQNKLFTVEEADRLLKVINANQSNDPAVNAALSALRNSVKGSVTEVDAAGGVYAPAVKAAAERFKMHDMLPALQAASKGELDADKFVARHIVGAKPESVKSLADVLKSTDQQAFDQAKAQVGEYLRKAAYGINEAGDAGFRPAGFSKALDSLGERLKAFYSPEEIAQLKQLSRVGSYMYAFPAQAAVSTSSSGVPVQNALMRIIGAKIPFLGTGIDITKNALQGAQRRANVRTAMGAEVPYSQLELLPGEQQKYQNALSRLLSPVAYTGGYLAQ